MTFILVKNGNIQVLLVVSTPIRMKDVWKPTAPGISPAGGGSDSADTSEPTTKVHVFPSVCRRFDLPEESRESETFKCGSGLASEFWSERRSCQGDAATADKWWKRTETLEK